MLSELSNQMIGPFTGKQYPRLPEPITYRVKYRRVGPMQFISLLDLQRTFQKILVRAGVPVWYTLGFNPHPKIIYAAPLPVGTQSECEYLDLRMDRAMPCEEVLERLNHELTDDFRALAVYVPTTKLFDAVWSSYDYDLHFVGASEETAEKIRAVFAADRLMMTKKSKSGEKEVDILPLIRRMEVAFVPEEKIVKLHAVLSVEAEKYLNPEMIVSAIRTALAIDDPIENNWTIMRRELYFADGETVFT